jgi:hypothetical protein
MNRAKASVLTVTLMRFSTLARALGSAEEQGLERQPQRERKKKEIKKTRACRVHNFGMRPFPTFSCWGVTLNSAGHRLHHG